MTAPAKALLNRVHGQLVFGRRVRVLAEVLAAAMPSGAAEVLDLGCGDGQVAASIMQLRPELVISGVDVLLRPQTHIPVTVYDGQKLPFENARFDYVTITDVLHHTDDPAAVLAEAARVARRGVVVKDHLREGLLAGSTLRLMDWVGNRGHDVRLPYNYLDEREWHAVFEQTGLAVETWTENLALYAWPLDWVFGRGLHFVAFLRRASHSGSVR